MSILDLNIGIDFGTRYTKVCIRDTSRKQSWIIPIGNAESILDKALILSQVAISRTGKVIAGLTRYEWSKIKGFNGISIDYIKMRLAHLDIDQGDSLWYSPKIDKLLKLGLSIEDILENICAFFLLRVIERSKDWFYQNQQNLLKNMTVEWSVSVGVPVAYWDSPALARFEKVLGLAWCLSEIPNLGDSLNTINSKLMKLKKKIDLEEIPCFAIPEVAAAISSFTSSRQAKEGVYTFFDVGGGTIEGVSFRFYRLDEQKRIDFYTALVEPLGVNSIAKRIIDQFPEVKEANIERSIILKGDSILNSIKKISPRYRTPKRIAGSHIANKHQAIYELVEKDLNRQHLNTFFVQNLILSQRWIHAQVAKVFRHFFKKVESYSGQVFLFLSGGGKVSTYYQDTINSTYETFVMKSTSIPRYKYMQVPVPSDCKMSEIGSEHFHRFTVAYGLSIPDYDYPQIGLPTQFPDLPPQRAVPCWVPETSLDD